MRRMRATGAAATCAAVVLSACRDEARPNGEALVVVATDVAIPAFVDRVRIDVYDGDGLLEETRTVPALSPIDWPLSFSIVSARREEARTALVRIRGFRAARTNATASGSIESGVPPWSEPAVATSIAEACANAPEIRPGESVTLRRGNRPITSVLAHASGSGQTCTEPTESGSVAARVVISHADQYIVEVASVVPDPSRDGPGGDTTLALRTTCDVPTSQIACAAPIDGRPARLELRLSPGIHHVVTGGREAAFADVTLRVRVRNEIVSVDAASDTDGGATPSEEPPVATTIDRLVAARIEPGRRGKVAVALRGDCFGTEADLRGRRSCVDRAGELVPVVAQNVEPSLSRTAVVVPGSWAGHRPEPCTAPLRRADGPFDAETCIPGGVFVLGNDLALADGDFRAQPERVRMVEPFFMDTHEVTVGRWRAALARGFLPPIPTDPIENPGPIRVDDACSWTRDPGDREAFALACVSWENARAFCVFLGGDLPSEDEWEYAATAAGRAQETSYPWGDDAPDCDRAVLGRRERIGVVADDRCTSRFGPTTVDDPSWTRPGADVTALGVSGLAGNVSEWTSSGFLPYAHRAWIDAGLRRPLLPQQHAPLRAVRGGNWASEILLATGSARSAHSPLPSPTIGFRCVRKGR